MSQLSDQFQCSLGTANFQLEEYTLKEEPLTKEFTGRYGTRVTVTGKGTLSAADASGLTAAVLASDVAFRVAAQDFVVKGLSGVEEYRLNAAWCSDGGPFVTFERAMGGSPLDRKVSFTLKADRSVNSNSAGGGQVNTYAEKHTIGADGLDVVTRAGELFGSGSRATFFGSVVPAFNATYSLPDWVTTFDYSSGTDNNGAADSHVSYSLTAKELAGPLPVGAGIGNPCDGEFTKTIEIDDQRRRTVTYDYDLLLNPTSDMQPLVDSLRPVGCIRERVSTSWVQHCRLQASFTAISSGDPGGLADWRETFQATSNTPTFEEKCYPGAAPVLVQAPTNFVKLTQEGSLVCLGNGYLAAPDPMFPDRFLAPPVVEYTRVNDNETSTRWTYVMAVSAVINLGNLNRGSGNPDSVDHAWVPGGDF